MGVYDWFLMLGVLYTGLGSDLFLNWGAGLIVGKRLRPDSANFFERIYYQVHARGDPNMRATPPVAGPADRLPAWVHALAVVSGTLTLALEVILVIGFLRLHQSGVVPEYARFAAYAGLMRGVSEISYWHVLTQNDVEPLRGKWLAWYWLIGMPQAFIPFLAAERFYEAAGTYTFVPGRFLTFLAVPVALMVLMRLSYRLCCPGR
jgi:hypothetical protein